MTEKKVLLLLNVSLTIFAGLLVLNLFDVDIPNLGRVIALSDISDPICFVESENHLTELQNLDSCCLFARKQIACEPYARDVAGVQLHVKCHSLSEDVPQYWLNNKAYLSCTQSSIWK